MEGRALKVLVTNNRLSGRGGTESFVRDFARGLQERGHSVFAYSSDTTEQERLFQNDVVPVVTDLDLLTIKPDVIHAQHHLDAMTALSAIRDVPVLYHCHGATWRDYVPRHPRIHHYVAVSATLAARIAAEYSIPPSDISVLPNGVDLGRFLVRREPPDRIRTALFYNSRHSADSDTLAAVSAATAARSIGLDLIGTRVGSLTDAPEKLLPRYDLVFASGVSAIEALASGCAVIVLGRTSCGELVTPANFDQLRQVNFSIAVNSPPPSAERVGHELDRYTADDARVVSERLRRVADFRHLVDALLELYAQVIARHQQDTSDLGAELAALSRYLRRIVPLIKVTDHVLDGQWSSATRADSFDELRADVARLERRIVEATSRADS